MVASTEKHIGYLDRLLLGQKLALLVAATAVPAIVLALDPYRDGVRTAAQFQLAPYVVERCPPLFEPLQFEPGIFKLRPGNRAAWRFPTRPLRANAVEQDRSFGRCRRRRRDVDHEGPCLREGRRPLLDRAWRVRA